MRERDVVVISRPAIVVAVIVLAAAALAALIVVPGPREAVASTLWPLQVADRAALDAQRTAAEDAIQRGHVKAIDQLRRVGQLTLAIPATEAAAIAQRANADLLAVRREALGAVGQLVGVSASELQTYVAATEARLGASGAASEAGVLLAPDLFAIVRRANEVFQQVADNATRELTRAPASPSPAPARPPAPSPTAAPSPSPTRSP